MVSIMNTSIKLTGKSIKTPIGTTDAKSVRVRRRAFFSFSVNSSPTKLLLRSPIAAATSIARSWVPCQTSWSALHDNSQLIFHGDKRTVEDSKRNFKKIKGKNLKLALLKPEISGDIHCRDFFFFFFKIIIKKIKTWLVKGLWQLCWLKPKIEEIHNLKIVGFLKHVH